MGLRGAPTMAQGQGLASGHGVGLLFSFTATHPYPRLPLEGEGAFASDRANVHWRIKKLM